MRSVFSKAVSHYDLLNHTFSLGRDIFWRKAATRRVAAFDTGRMLDVACGTGDLALALAEAHPGAKVTGLDFVYPMLQRAIEKSKEASWGRRIDWMCGDAMGLPFPDNHFDAVTMAFGIRNIPDRPDALREMLRVLTPGGRCLILELTFPQWPPIRRFYNSYLNRMIPKVGGLVSGNELAYKYLADSIMDFPSPAEFENLMKDTGYIRTGYHNFTFGICAMHWGVKRT